MCAFASVLARRLSASALIVILFVQIGLPPSPVAAQSTVPTTPSAEEEARGFDALLRMQMLPVDTTLAPAAPSDSTFPPLTAAPAALSGHIAFESDRDGDFGLYGRDANAGRPAQVLLDDPGNEVTPVWSPDGKQLLFVSDRSGNWEIYRWTQESNQVVRLTQHPAEDIHPAWSPGGDRVVFASRRGGEYFGLYSMRPDGQDVRPLAQIAGQHLTSPAYSPDGGRIAFMQASVTLPVCQWNSDIWVMDQDGRNMRRVTNHLAGDLYPHWTPDGRIIYGACSNFIDSNVVVMHIDTGTQITLVGGFLSNEWGAIYSPDGQYIAFNSDKGNNVDVYIATKDGNSAFDLTLNPAADLAASWTARQTPNSLAGRVTDESGHGLPCVTISAGSLKTTTDGQGYYTLHGAPDGTYTLTAGNGPYTFTPPSIVVTVPAPGGVSYDFKGKPVEANRPVLLIPGIFASLNLDCMFAGTNCEQANWTWMPTAGDYYAQFVAQLSEAKVPVKVFHYNWSRPMGTHAAALRDAVAGMRQPGGQVDIVGHSMGGLVARGYIQGDLYAPNSVAHLVTLGSPHLGAGDSYTAWEGGIRIGGGTTFMLYRVGLALLAFYANHKAGPGGGQAVYATNLELMRLLVPSNQGLLPTYEYLYDAGRNDQLKLLQNHIWKNNYLPQLNERIWTLTQRTQVITLAGTGSNTPTRFYVTDRSVLDFPLWDDGKPVWSRQAEFMDDGDATVPLVSALLPDAAVSCKLSGVTHGGFANFDEVRRGVSATLGIPITTGALAAAAAAAPAQEEPFLIVALDGPADVTVVDALGRRVGPGGVTVPGARYLKTQAGQETLIIIPSPQVGGLQITADGGGKGVYRLGVLDTFSPEPAPDAQPVDYWRAVQGQVEPGARLNFTTAVSQDQQTAPPLNVVTPVIAAPLRIDAWEVAGWCAAGSTVQVRYADSQALAGSAVAGSDGRFVVALSAPLRPGQRVYPLSNGITGVPVEATLRTLQLPLIRR